MKRTRVLILCAALATGPTAKAEELKLPPQVTPAMRAACEGDVRRLCVGSSPTFAKVKRCVAVKFLQLGKRCQIELASAGFSAFSR
ncbi:MAG TPA: hypothetical protein VH852_06090 [Hyphomicrobium sp.]|jgi:hypothetical protein